MRTRKKPSRRPQPERLTLLPRSGQEMAVRLLGRGGDSLVARPLDMRVDADISLPIPNTERHLRKGCVLLVRVGEALRRDLWRGEIIRIFGRMDDAAVQEELVRINHEVPDAFPEEVLAQAADLPPQSENTDLEGRRDLRTLPFVTIDGDDARDFDDAILVRPRPAEMGGGWLLSVAIADVSHYVTPAKHRHDTCLDNEAFFRGNSWYFPLSVTPMLPERLSNGLCSLKPREDRLVMLCEIPFSADGSPEKPYFAQGVIRSAARLTYTRVKKCLIDGDEREAATLLGEENGHAVFAMLKDAFRLFARLKRKRVERGSLDFDLPEAEYAFDAKRGIKAIRVRERNDAHNLIEEFMIAVNEAVARHLAEAGVPFLYRVHPAPDEERLRQILNVLSATLPSLLPEGGHPSGLSGKDLQGILQRSRGTPQEFLVNRLCLRAMAQARYQPFNEGHFGLASEAYCHFTSPIRRYADLLVHRALKHSLGCGHGPIPAGQRLLRIADQLNARERAAMECEREMARRMACLLLKDHVGESFDAVISAVNDFGLFIELKDMPVEGMIRLTDLGRDRFDVDSSGHSLRGRHTGMRRTLGEALRVRLKEVDMTRLSLRFVPASAPSEGRRRKAEGRRRIIMKKKASGR